MADAQVEDVTSGKPLRLWPGVVAVALQWAGFLLARVFPDAAMYGILGAAVAGLVIVVWWLFFSRAPWLERVGALALMPFAVIATKLLVHPSIAKGGMGMLLYIYSVPVLSLALVAWAAASRRLARGPRLASMVAAILLACGVFTMVRSGGVSGDGRLDLHWRWTPTPEDLLLAEGGDQPAPRRAPEPAPPAVAAATPEKPLPPPVAAEPSAATPSASAAKPALARAGESEATVPVAPAAAAEAALWPGFRGPRRDGVVRGLRIATDWSKSPPRPLWRKPIGPGWSSFAVVGDLVYTMEQRGESESVSCYRLTTGDPVWRHGDAVRFTESEGGVGPRATPALGNGRVYSFGATGRLNALDAASGALAWSRDAAADTGVEVPAWGFAGSPIVVGDTVVVAASGRLAAYDVASGQPRWLGPQGGAGYASPHLATLDGVPQILLLRGSRTISVAPADGALLWEHVWEKGVGMLQPALAADGDLVITVGDAMGGIGMRRLAVSRGPGGWSATERWTSRGLKPYFNDFVVHEGHAFGFDGSILACVDLADGTRKWKGGRYGHGQLVLLPEQDLLLVVSEQGELALVRAAPDQFTELARVPALEGKTWNHPALVGDRLLVRNGQEMAAFQLARAE